MHKSIPPASSLEEIQEALAPLLDQPASSAILLDLDGTLAPIVARPEDVQVPPAINRLIRRLTHKYMAVAIVSGRAANAAKRIIGNAEIAYIGNHGFETLLPGHATVVCEEAQPYISSIKELVEKSSFDSLAEAGVWLEDKTATVSYHFRRARDPDEALRFIRETVVPVAEKLGLEVSDGRMVVEIKPPVEINKGVSIGRLLDRLEVDRAIYVGDDTTDIDALKELRKRRRKKGRVMIGVGVISKEMPDQLVKYCDLMVARVSGVESLLQILAGEEL